MSGKLAWNGAWTLGPYQVGEILPAELRPPPDAPQMESEGAIWTDLDDVGLCLITYGDLLIGLTTWEDFYVEGVNLIGSNVEIACEVYFGGVRERINALPLVQFIPHKNGIEVIARDDAIRRITLERFELLPE